MAGESVELEKLDVSESQKRHISGNLLLYFTDKTRKSETILKEQKANIDQRMTILREISELAYKTKKSIVEGDIDNIGSILHRGWNLKKEMAGGISDEDIDRMYEAAINAGATGGKVAGAGGGGFLLLYCPRENQNKLRKEFTGLRELPFLLERDGSKVIFNMRRYEWK